MSYVEMAIIVAVVVVAYWCGMRFGIRIGLYRVGSYADRREVERRKNRSYGAHPTSRKYHSYIRDGWLIEGLEGTSCYFVRPLQNPYDIGHIEEVWDVGEPL